MNCIETDLIDKITASERLENSTVRIFLHLMAKADNRGYINERTSLQTISDHCKLGYGTASKGVRVLRKYNMIETKAVIGVETHYKVELSPEKWAL